MIEAGLFALLSTEPSISELVADRVYPVILPTDGTFPAITYQIAGGTSKPTLTTTGLQKIRLQLDCWATDAYLTAATVRAAVTKFLAGRACALSDGAWVSFQLIGPLDFYSGGDEAFRASVEFYVLHT
jgi:Protein of unknown function (DUF3168)